MRAIVTRYFGPTDFKPARWQARDTDKGGKRIYVSANWGESHLKAEREAVRRLITAMDWEGKWISGSISSNSNAWVPLPYDLIMASRDRDSDKVLDATKVRCPDTGNSANHSIDKKTPCATCGMTGQFGRVYYFLVKWRL